MMIWNNTIAAKISSGTADRVEPYADESRADRAKRDHRGLDSSWLRVLCIEACSAKAITPRLAIATSCVRRMEKDLEPDAALPAAKITEDISVIAKPTGKESCSGPAKMKSVEVTEETRARSPARRPVERPAAMRLCSKGVRKGGRRA